MRHLDVMERERSSGSDKLPLEGMMSQPADLRFEVRRNGTTIGEHIVRFRRTGSTLHANFDVEVAVGLGPVTVFRFSHRGHEVWEDGRFVGLDCTTNDDGKRSEVHANRSGGNIVVESSATTRTLVSTDTIPLTYWNHLCLERPLFSPKDGTSAPVRFERHFGETVTLAGGRKVQATRHSLKVTPILYTWYDSAGVWTGLRTEGRDGSTIQYRCVR